MRDQAFRDGCRQTRRGAVVLVAAAFLATVAALAALGVGEARAARTISLNDTARLHLTSHHGFTLNEQGSASGTVSGTIYIHLNVSSTNHVTAALNIYPRGGSLSGNAYAAYQVKGSIANFKGTMNITGGSGRYSHARGSGLSFTGTIQRSSDAVNVRVSGRFSY
jgi:hypothetical protein